MQTEFYHSSLCNTSEAMPQSSFPKGSAHVIPSENGSPGSGYCTRVTAADRTQWGFVQLIWVQPHNGYQVFVEICYSLNYEQVD